MKRRFVKEKDINYLRNASHIFAGNSPSLLHDKEILMSLAGVSHKIETFDAITGDFKYPKSMISSVQHRKQTDTGGFLKCLELKKGLRL